ncbi:MAG: TIGR04283 family arsenosugar biosynthesis glycosyltransferase [Sporocytophaga sp.]|uniref:TIGR04283 family arsenosugar biosynthesis glycosyltransferase n=1 Tax=Sporocytophaga sp. TaxID=2231183 RepID=UPI001B2DC258|nr:TIGR04283 family arsenosugar biosynthesis glycosyltransferase [Sporocytophaga sp.]MBO9701780.1 TIGR04283 family arsenosugar biosynthesis glycosyltransferase [Sporocytophaga sp.]
MKISVIIPTFQEEENVGRLIKYLKRQANTALLQEIIIADGNSDDETVTIARQQGARVLPCPVRGRAAQMNYAAARATGDILYFLHANTFPPKGFCDDIIFAVKEGYSAGCFRLKVDHNHWFLQLNCWFTRFDSDYVKFGDQSLFITKEQFNHCNGFDEKLYFLEDLELIQRIKSNAKFKIVSKHVLISAKKYLEKGIYKLQMTFFLLFIMYKLKYSQDKMLEAYKRMTHSR